MRKFSNNILIPSRRVGRTEGYIAELQNENVRLRAALEEIITYNRTHAEDEYGDPERAEAWACVKTARKALKGE